MPITFLTSLERKRYEQMPEDIREGDLRRFKAIFSFNN
jgi:hypothetical protein